MIRRRLPGSNPIESLAALLDGLDGRACVAFGVPRHGADTVPIKPGGRSRETFEWPRGATVLMLDIDACPINTPFAAVDRYLRETVPGFADSLRLYRDSQTARIRHQGKPIARDGRGEPTRKFRLYVIVASGALVEPFWNLFKARLAEINVLVEKKPTPEGLDFAGLPHVAAGSELTVEPASSWDAEAFESMLSADCRDRRPLSGDDLARLRTQSAY